MTKFDKTKFDMGRGGERWVMYEGKFVARFKYSNAAAAAKDFVKFLAANFTVEEYFEMLKTLKPNCPAQRPWAPGEILETKGHINYNIRKAMRKEGFSTKEELLAHRRAQYNIAA